MMDGDLNVTPSPASVIAAAAADLRFLSVLHDRELQADSLRHLSQSPAASWFGLALPGEDAATGFKLVDTFLADAAERVDEAVEQLAVDYADLYLTFGKRVAPNESYWLTIDHIERQEPMFSVRSWYGHYGLAAQNWRKRADDHLVHELEFVAKLLERESLSAWIDAGRFLDQHLLRWSADYFSGVARGAATNFYAGVAILTESLLLTVRSLLETVTGEKRRQPAEQIVAEPITSVAFAPGVAEGW